MSSVLVVMYVTGFCVELYGLVTVARDIADAQTRAREITEHPSTHVHGGTRESGEVQRALRSRDPVRALASVAERQERALRAATATQEYAAKEARENIVEVLVGNLGRRRRGLYALVIGLLISTAGNVLSALT